MNASEILDRLDSLGCRVRVQGTSMKVRGPDCAELHELVSELRTRREDAMQLLRGRRWNRRTSPRQRRADAVDFRGGKHSSDREHPILTFADLQFLADLRVGWE